MRHMSDIDLIKHAAGELGEARAREIEAHLGVCDSCRREASDLAALRGALGAWTVDASSRDRWAAIEGRLEARRPQAGRLCHKTPRAGRPYHPEAPEMPGRHPDAGRMPTLPWRLAGQWSRIAAAVVFGVGLGYVAGRASATLKSPLDRSQPIIVAQASKLAAADELGLYVLESPAAAGLFTMVLDLTDASGATDAEDGMEVSP